MMLILPFFLFVFFSSYSITHVHLLLHKGARMFFKAVSFLNLPKGFLHGQKTTIKTYSTRKAADEYIDILRNPFIKKVSNAKDLSEVKGRNVSSLGVSPKPSTDNAELENGASVSSGKNLTRGKKIIREARDDEEKEASDSLEEHPVHLWKDEEGILFRFGMGGRVSPSSVQGFEGLFRQHWKDFHVTEMVPDHSEPCGGKCLPRTYNFQIPTLSATTSHFMHESNQTADEENPSSFFSVSVEERLQEICREKHGADCMHDNTFSHSPQVDSKKDILQCILHKKHVAHSTAISLLAQSLRIHPKAISVAGMKDYIGDTVQRVRIENVSPSSVLLTNKLFRSKGIPITLSHFSYESDVLLPGDLFGNHFKIILRGVNSSLSVIQDAIHGFQQFGFPNYYGCQRFAWFGGGEDAAFALLAHNPLVFAFRFLNYTHASRTLRELLQRPRKYPHPIQDEYRRNVVRRLRQLSISPADLDEEPFLSCPSLADAYDGTAPILNTKQNLVLSALWDAYMQLNLQSRRPTAQRLSSYLWNQALTLRLHHFGGQKVLKGDFCIPNDLRREALSAENRFLINSEYKQVATAETIHEFSIQDVVHPGFSFDSISLPSNAVKDFYLQICEKYHLRWDVRHSRGGLPDFLEPPRPIVRHPLNLKYNYQPDLELLTLEFALERGCYANVALTELMKLTRCAGAERIQLQPTPDIYWDSIGDRDPGYVVSLQDIYAGYEDGVGFIGDTEEVELNNESQAKIWDYDGPLFLDKKEDPYVKAVQWGRQHLLRPMQRRELEAKNEKKKLFEHSLAKKISDEELQGYAGHMIPLPPNFHANKVRRSMLKRQRRYAGAPRITPRFGREVIVRKSRKAHATRNLPEFYQLNKNSWNVTW